MSGHRRVRDISYDDDEFDDYEDEEETGSAQREWRSTPSFQAWFEGLTSML